MDGINESSAREAGFVESTVEACLAPIRRFWCSRVDALERYLDHIAQSTLRKEDNEKMKNAIDKLMMFRMAVSDMPKAQAFCADKLAFKVATDHCKDDDNWWVSLTLPESRASITLTTLTKR